MFQQLNKILPLVRRTFFFTNSSGPKIKTTRQRPTMQSPNTASGRGVVPTPAPEGDGTDGRAGGAAETGGHEEFFLFLTLLIN